MTTPSETPVFAWLRPAGFPHVRLEPKAELLLCFAAAAAREEAGAAKAGSGALVRQDPAVAAAQRAHALRRSRVHYKSDNSAKV